MAKKKNRKMTVDELSQETAKFDQENVIKQSRPLTVAERKRFNAIRGKSRGIRRILELEISDPKLIARAEAHAARNELTLPELIEKSLRSSLDFADPR